MIPVNTVYIFETEYTLVLQEIQGDGIQGISLVGIPESNRLHSTGHEKQVTIRGFV